MDELVLAAIRVRNYLRAQSLLGGPTDHVNLHTVMINDNEYTLTRADLAALIRPILKDHHSDVAAYDVTHRGGVR